MAIPMTINVGLAQTLNSTDIENNFKSIISLLEKFRLAAVEVVLFPECCLSGFSSKMNECTLELMQPYFDQLQDWTDSTGIEVVIPTAISENGFVYNAGRLFKRGGNTPFYKTGLTDSEKTFFSVPNYPNQKVFEISGFRFAILICSEAEHHPWAYFKHGEADAVFWPGYWGWTVESEWGAEEKPGKLNPIYSNVEQWKIPVLQANFASNDLDGRKGPGPEGLSFVIGGDNDLKMKGPHNEVGGVVVKLGKGFGTTTVLSCRRLD